MKAFLINPLDKTITEVEHSGDYHEIYKICDYSIFEVIALPNRDGVYIDEEGLLKSPNPDSFWSMPELYGESAAFTGKGFVLGSDKKGNSTAPKITLDELKRIVVFLSPDELLTYITG